MPPTDPVARALELIEGMLGVCEKATPGPWVPRYSDRVATQDDTDGTKSIAHCYSKPHYDLAGNQRFIAAARTFGPAALLLAKGFLEQGHHPSCDNQHVGWAPYFCDCKPGKLAAEFIERMVGMQIDELSNALEVAGCPNYHEERLRLFLVDIDHFPDDHAMLPAASLPGNAALTVGDLRRISAKLEEPNAQR